MTSIKRKLKICIECGLPRYIFSKGRCEECAKKSYTPIQKTPIKKTAKPKVPNTSLNTFFDRHIQQCKVSAETGQPIYQPSRLNICHILPKRLYKSVESDDMNVIYLNWQEHTDLDRCLDRNDFETLEKILPKTWAIIVDRLPYLLTTSTEYGKLKINLENYLENKNL